MIPLRSAVLFLAVALPALAQQDAARQSEALDQALGPNANLPMPDPQPPVLGTLLPAWLSGQPYRQQPLLTGVPIGGTIRGRTRSPGGDDD